MSTRMSMLLRAMIPFIGLALAGTISAAVDPELAWAYPHGPQDGPPARRECITLTEARCPR